MWHPTRNQWHCIWAATLIMLLAWLTRDPEPYAFLLPFTTIGVLFVWHATGKQKDDT